MMKKKRFNYLKFIYDKGLYRDFLIYAAYHPGVSKRRVAFWFLKSRGFSEEIQKIIYKDSWRSDPFIQSIAKEKWL